MSGWRQMMRGRVENARRDLEPLREDGKLTAWAWFHMLWFAWGTYMLLRN